MVASARATRALAATEGNWMPLDLERTEYEAAAEERSMRLSGAGSRLRRPARTLMAGVHGPRAQRSGGIDVAEAGGRRARTDEPGRSDATPGWSDAVRSRIEPLSASFADYLRATKVGNTAQTRYQAEA